MPTLFHFFLEIHISTTRNSSNLRIGTRFNKRVPASRIPVYSLTFKLFGVFIFWHFFYPAGVGISLLVDALRLTRPDFVIQLQGGHRSCNLPAMTSDFVSMPPSWIFRQVSWCFVERVQKWNVVSFLFKLPPAAVWFWGCRIEPSSFPSCCKWWLKEGK